MKIAYSHLSGGLRVGIRLDEDEFDRTYEGWNRTERGAKMRVKTLTASVDMENGEVDVKAYGNLYNKDGTVGLRDRDDYLEPGEISIHLRSIIAAEWQRMRDRIAGVTEVTFK